MPTRALIAGFALRLTLAIVTRPNFDLQSYGIVSAIVSNGGNVYAQTNRYNYSPLWSFVVTALAGSPTLIRMFLSIVDVGNALLIGKLYGTKVGAFYALNPVSIFIVGYGGQFETLAALPVLLVLLVYKRQL